MSTDQAGKPPKAGDTRRKKKIPDPHPIVSVLQPDLKNHAHVITLSGYPGNSAIAGHIRLYVHHDLQAYYEISKDDITHSWPAVTATSTEPINVSIKADVKPHLVVHTRVSSAAAALLNGPMVSTLLAAAIESAVTQRGWEPTQPPPPPPHGRVGNRPYRGGDGEPPVE